MRYSKKSGQDISTTLIEESLKYASVLYHSSCEVKILLKKDCLWFCNRSSDSLCVDCHKTY